MATPPDVAKRGPSQEGLLLDYLQRLEKRTEGRKVVHLRLSALQSVNRRDQHVRAAADCFESLIGTMAGQLFKLKNSDVFFIYKNGVVEQTDWKPNGTNVVLLRQLYRHGILREQLHDTDGDGKFDVSVEFDPFNNPISTNDLGKVLR